MTLRVDMGSADQATRTRKVTFIIDGARETVRIGATKVTVAAAFGGSGQVVKITSAKAGVSTSLSGWASKVAAARSALTLAHEARGNPAAAMELAHHVSDGVTSCSLLPAGAGDGEQRPSLSVVATTGRLQAASGDRDSSVGLPVVPASDFPSFAVSGVAVTSGKWYYEVLLRSAKLMQLGWGRVSFSGDETQGSGAGDDGVSVAYDGWRRQLWGRAEPREWGATWSEGDILGCALDLDAGTVSYSLNGSYDNGMGVAFTSLPDDAADEGYASLAGDVLRFVFAPPD